MTELDTGHRDAMDDDAFAFPRERKLPIHDAAHVRNAVARFDQVEDVSDAERDAAWKRIEAAARRHGVTCRKAAGANSASHARVDQPRSAAAWWAMCSPMKLAMK